MNNVYRLCFHRIRIKSIIELSKIMLTEEDSSKTLLMSQKSADTFHNLLISSTITSDHLMPPQTHMFVPAIKNSSNFKVNFKKTILFLASQFFLF